METPGLVFDTHTTQSCVEMCLNMSTMQFLDIMVHLSWSRCFADFLQGSVASWLAVDLDYEFLYSVTYAECVQVDTFTYFFAKV